MASQIEEFLAKKKEQTTHLDLHNCTANSKEDLRKLVEKVPEFKIKPEKKLDDIKIREKKFKFKLPKKEHVKKFPFSEPTPTEMRGVALDELYSVNIQWKMLTSLRPKSKLDEEYFSRQVELGTDTLKTRQTERKIPRETFLRRKKNASGGIEARFLSCKECGVEFCTGENCKVFEYDSFKRILITTIQSATTEQAHEQGIQEKKTPKKKFGGSKAKPNTGNNTVNVVSKISSIKEENKIISVKTNPKNVTVNAKKGNVARKTNPGQNSPVKIVKASKNNTKRKK